MTFPIKKRINTELFINGNKLLYLYKVDKETDQEKGKTEPAVKVNVGM